MPTRARHPDAVLIPFTPGERQAPSLSAGGSRGLAVLAWDGVCWCSGPQQGCGVPGAGQEFLPEEIRAGGGLCPQLSKEHGITVQHAVKIEGVFFPLVLRKNKMCKPISPLSHSLSLGRTLGFPKKPLLHQQAETGREGGGRRVRVGEAFGGDRPGRRSQRLHNGRPSLPRPRPQRRTPRRHGSSGLSPRSAASAADLPRC